MISILPSKSTKYLLNFETELSIRHFFIMYMSVSVTASNKGNTLDHSMSKQNRLQRVQLLRFEEMEDIWIEMSFQRCKLDKQRKKVQLSLASDLDSAVWRLETEDIHLKRARGVVNFQICPKWEIARVENFCTKEMQVRLGNGKEIVLQLTNPTTKTLSIKIIPWVRAILCIQTWWLSRRKHG